MTARAQYTAHRRPAVPGAARKRLPWWWLALPAAAFAALLALTLSGGGSASTTDTVRPLALLLEHLAQVLPG